YGKTYLYLNGGNFYYAELVKQYIGGGSGNQANPSEFWGKMKTEIEKYQGWPYVWGGKNPTTGFDCSGLTANLYQFSAGITIDSYTVTQYEATEAVSIKEAKAGDLIFFRGTYGAPDFISHVGIYVNETTMYDSNSSGIGYHNWQD
ncbi:C40 family peptidase, partial [Enterococcus faecium]|uniref:C40 family peptidase n=1 Tax=Enterococcus faecium TaxID=1352 RepID=UPI00265526E7